MFRSRAVIGCPPLVARLQVQIPAGSDQRLIGLIGTRERK